jgi:predicted transcriptional regulator
MEKLKGMTREELFFMREQHEDSLSFVKKYLEQLKNAKKEESNYILTLKNLMFMVSHKMRHSLCNISGLLNEYNDTKHSHIESSKIVELIKDLTLTLDCQTREVTDCIHEAKMKLEIKEVKNDQESL